MNEREGIDLELTTKILLAMGLGIILGLTVHFCKDIPEANRIIEYKTLFDILNLMGNIFISLLKMLIVPLVFFSLLSGILALGDISALGRVGLKAFFLYMLTTTIAITSAIIIAYSFNIGKDTSIDVTKNTAYKIKEAPSFIDILNDIIPENIFLAFTSGSMLQIIFFAIFFAIALLSLNAKVDTLKDNIELINKTNIKMVHMVMKTAPYSIFALVTINVSHFGVERLADLSSYILLLLFVLFLHLFGTLMLILKIFSGLNPKIFLYKMREAQLIAFSTASSNATMPVTMQTLTEKLGVSNSISSFTVPFGATINMDGTAMMHGVATIFLANLYGIDLNIYDYATIVGMSVLASIGTAGIPSVGLVMLSMVFVQVGIPVEAIGIIFGVDRILDMVRTSVNISGDAVITCIIAKQENALDEKIYYNFSSGMDEDEFEDLTKKDLLKYIQKGEYEQIIHEDGRIEFRPPS